jgi:hypothetical protein
MAQTLAIVHEESWYRSLTGKQWHPDRVEPGMAFDGFENYALILTAGGALKELLPEQRSGSGSHRCPGDAITRQGVLKEAGGLHFLYERVQ